MAPVLDRTCDSQRGEMNSMGALRGIRLSRSDAFSSLSSFSPSSSD
jgi:hypothetical protein